MVKEGKVEWQAKGQLGRSGVVRGLRARFHVKSNNRDPRGAVWSVTIETWTGGRSSFAPRLFTVGSGLTLDQAKAVCEEQATELLARQQKCDADEQARKSATDEERQKLLRYLDENFVRVVCAGCGAGGGYVPKDQAPKIFYCAASCASIPRERV